jgi:hypothetical protein
MTLPIFAAATVRRTGAERARLFAASLAPVLAPTACGGGADEQPTRHTMQGSATTLKSPGCPWPTP